MKGFPVVAVLALFFPVLVRADCYPLNDEQALACFDRLAQCAAIEQDELRLACYRADGAVQAKVPAAAVPTTSAIEEAFPVARQQSKSDGPEPMLTAKVVKTDQNAYKYYYLWLDNGHVWREKEKSRFRYKAGDTITISKGALGANYLRLEGRTGKVLVERVK